MAKQTMSDEGLVQKFIDHLGEKGIELKFDQGHLWIGGKGGYKQVGKDELEHLLRTWMLEVKVNQTAAKVNNMIKIIGVRLNPHPALK